MTLSHHGFTMKSLNNPVGGNKYPCLSTKAHDCRQIMKWLVHEVSKARDLGSERGQRRAALAWTQNDFCELLEHSPPFLRGHPAIRARITGFARLDLYAKFISDAQAAEENRPPYQHSTDGVDACCQ